MKKLLPILLLLFISHLGFGQEHNVDSLFKAFEKNLQIKQTKDLHYIVFDDETNLSYYSLILNSSIEDLLKYTNDSSAVVRCLIFSGLVEKGTPKDTLIAISNTYIHDTTKVSFMSGDVVTSWTVSGYLQVALKVKEEHKLNNIDYEAEIEKIINKLHIIIEGAHHGLIHKDDLLQLDSIVCSNANIKVLSFTLYNGKNTYNSSSNIVTKQMKTIIKKSKPGDKFYFEDIKVEDSNKKARYLGVLELEVN